MSDFSGRRRGIACPQCQTSMREIMRIAPLRNEPGLIAYECPACEKMTSEIWPAGDQPDDFKLRPTGLGHGVYKDVPDYSIYFGEWCIGRIYETRTGPADRWFWALHTPAAEKPCAPQIMRRRWTRSRPSSRRAEAMEGVGGEGFGRAVLIAGYFIRSVFM